MNFIYHKSFIKKQLLLSLRYLLIILLSFCFTLTIPEITNAQSAGSESNFTPWWELGKVRVCGKLQCTNVSFPYFPYDIFDATKFTIASRTDLQDPQKTSNKLEIRASVVEQTLLSLYEKTVRNHHNESEPDRQVELQILDIRDWFAFNKNKKTLHPLTPKIEVGTKNEQTIIFTPDQPELGLTKETIVTVNEDDSIYNGKPIDKLAEEWRKIIQLNLSEALWGHEFDHVFPSGRLQIIIIISILTIIPIILLTVFSSLIRNLDYQLNQKLRELNELAKLDQEASYLNAAESSEIISENTEKVIDSINESSSEDGNQEITSNVGANDNNSSQKLSSSRKINFVFNRIKQFMLIKVNNTLKKSSTVFLNYQNTIKQLKNLTIFLSQILIWLRVLFLFIGLAVIVCVYPNTRIAAFFFIVQAIFLPVIWMLVNLADSITSFVIDYYLNRWAKEGQIAQPNSNRYALRVTTYSPALKGASTFLFTVIGIVLTIELLGIDISVLAGAGGAALLVGFLARNVL